MARRALLIGSETGGLRGVHSDVEVLDDALVSLGFATTKAVGPGATRDGIVERYRGLIADSGPDDAALVYYSGHGARCRNVLAGPDRDLPQWLHYILPTDIDDRSDDTFRGLLSQELSQLQRELTDKTPNVTTILDCCHSARMSRDGSMIPKADGQVAPFPWVDLEQRWARLRDAEATGPAGDDNPLAVRMVACSPDQSAYELADTDLGGPHGALTATLVSVLRSPLAATLTWRGLLDLVRPAVMDIVPMQRPELEGPLHRVLFSTETRDDTGVLPVRVEAGAALLDGAALFGMAEGDRYAIVPPDGDPSEPLATATVDRVVAGRARLLLTGAAADELPPGSSAHPIEVALGARPVLVVPPDHPDRPTVIEALRGRAHLRVVDAGANVLATVALDDRGIRLLDSAGEPLHADPRPLGAGLGSLADDLQKLARATHVRDLESGAGPAELPDDVEVSYLRLEADGAEVELEPGAHLFVGDRLVARFANTADETRYVAVLDVGLAGAVTVQTASEPDGVTLEKQECYELGRDPVTGGLDGIELFWPDIPAGAPRPETFVTIVADEKVEGLKRLEQSGVRARQAGAWPASALGRLVEALEVGRRDARPHAEQARPTRYRVHRFDFVLHPGARPAAADEPAFEVDERPDPSFRFVVPRSARAPERVAVRLKELVVHSNRSLLSAAVRLDALVVTAPPVGAEEPFRASTFRFDRVRDGDRLPFDDLLIHEGPVGRFLDLAIWVAKDDRRDLDLADLLARGTASTEVKGAAAALAGLAVAGPQAALAAGAAAAVGRLVRAGATVLDTVQGRSIGVYRTSLLPHQRFGAGARPPGVGRHPARGVIKAQDLSFAFEVVDLGLT